MVMIATIPAKSLGTLGSFLQFSGKDLSYSVKKSRVFQLLLAGIVVSRLYQWPSSFLISHSPSTSGCYYSLGFCFVFFPMHYSDECQTESLSYICFYFVMLQIFMLYLNFVPIKDCSNTQTNIKDTKYRAIKKTRTRYCVVWVCAKLCPIYRIYFVYSINDEPFD